MRLRSSSLSLVLGLLLSPIASTQCVWGSFDSTRINYAGGVLTNGASHVNLRNIITGNGGTLAPATATLTPQYLATVNVFYTSLLSTATGVLSAAEQAALQAWVTSGGTLIVTGDIFPLPAYESFTSWLGVTGWTSVSGCNVMGTIAAPHPVTVGITAFTYCTDSRFNHGSNALLLARNSTGANFSAVIEASTSIRGRMLVFGDHNMFSDSYINQSQNTALATNFVRWACTCASAGWWNYGAGWPGRNGVPAFTSSANPVLGNNITLTVGNSSGLVSVGVLVVGGAAVSIPTPLDGTLLARPDMIVGITVPAAGLGLPLTVPPVSAYCGSSVYFQALQFDPAASKTYSFTQGLQLLLGR
jgi:hypothetical protein